MQHNLNAEDVSGDEGDEGDAPTAADPSEPLHVLPSLRESQIKKMPSDVIMPSGRYRRTSLEKKGYEGTAPVFNRVVASPL